MLIICKALDLAEGVTAARLGLGRAQRGKCALGHLPARNTLSVGSRAQIALARANA